MGLALTACLHLMSLRTWVGADDSGACLLHSVYLGRNIRLSFSTGTTVHLNKADTLISVFSKRIGMSDRK